MLQFKRIAGFLAIGFILVFVAKIDKMGLFSVYFKTIAEVEVRNSQQVQEHVADVQISELSNAGNVQHPQVDAIWANLAEIVPCVGLGRLDLADARLESGFGHPTGVDVSGHATGARLGGLISIPSSCLVVRHLN
jgi:hypothetical protein